MANRSLFCTPVVQNERDVSGEEEAGREEAWLSVTALSRGDSAAVDSEK